MGQLVTALVVDDWRKLEVPRSGMHVRSEGKRIFLLPTPDGREGMTRFWELTASRDEVTTVAHKP